jgi:hypothetical protein
MAAFPISNRADDSKGFPSRGRFISRIPLTRDAKIDRKSLATDEDASLESALKGCHYTDCVFESGISSWRSDHGLRADSSESRLVDPESRGTRLNDGSKKSVALYVISGLNFLRLDGYVR